MKTILIPKETRTGETRTPLLPEAVQKICALGAELQVESGLGDSLQIPDAAYVEAGATIITYLTDALGKADVILRLNKPPGPEGLRHGAVHVSFLDPFMDLPLVERFARAGVSAICMEMIPRTTIAQSMDALSSQASLAGYSAVIAAAARIPRSLPMMMTPAGTLAPCRVFVIGAGVAGLQAIATAKRLGARVTAFDTRPAAIEQVESLGAKFINIDLGEIGQTEAGYARELTLAQQEAEHEAVGKAVARADIVITTAKVFGRPAPQLLTTDQVATMRPGSVIVDMATVSGGNVEGSIPDEDTMLHGVTIIGDTHLEARVPWDASQMYGNNLAHFIEHFWNREHKVFELRREDEIIAATLITHQGEVVHSLIKERMD